MGLFSYLNYDESKKPAIMRSLIMQCSEKINQTELNKRLEKGIGVEYFDENICVVEDSDKAKYMILDTGIKSKVKGEKETVSIAIMKLNNVWTGGFVGQRTKLVQHMKDTEKLRGEKMMLNHDIATAVSEAKENGATDEEIEQTVSKLKVEFEDAKIIRDAIVSDVKAVLLDCDEQWSSDIIREILMSVIQMTRYDIMNNSNGNWYKLNEERSAVCVNTGFIGDDGEYIYLVANMSESKSERPKFFDIQVLQSKMTMKKLGFELLELPDNFVELPAELHFDIDKVDLLDRARMNHCVIQRGYRAKEGALELTYREMRNRIRLSIELAIGLEKKGIKMIAPVYYLSGGKVQYCVPFYAKADMDLASPDGAILLGEKEGMYYAATIIDVYNALFDVMTLDRYPSAVWLKNMKPSDILDRPIEEFGQFEKE